MTFLNFEVLDVSFAILATEGSLMFILSSSTAVCCIHLRENNECNEHPQEMEKGATQGVTQAAAAAAPSCDFAAMVQTDLVSSSLPVLFDLWPSHPPESQQVSPSARPQHKHT